MFKNLMNFWKGKDFLSLVLKEFKDMLDDTEKMFTSVCRKLIDNQDEPGLKNNIYKLDKKVNTLQKNIRKRVIEHLSIQPTVDIPTSLLLMSVVKDAERVGDFAKNLFEVNGLLSSPIDKEEYIQLFNNIEKDISQLFQETKQAFIESDEDKAAESWNYKKEISQKCDNIIKSLAKSQLPANKAVCFTLMARYFKRIASHLTNIATSVILPLTDLDYFDENRT